MSAHASTYGGMREEAIYATILRLTNMAKKLIKLSYFYVIQEQKHNSLTQNS